VLGEPLRDRLGIDVPEQSVSVAVVSTRPARYAAKLSATASSRSHSQSTKVTDGSRRGPRFR